MVRYLIRKKRKPWSFDILVDSQIGLGAQVFWLKHGQALRIGLWLWIGPFEVSLDWGKP